MKCDFLGRISNNFTLKNKEVCKMSKELDGFLKEIREKREAKELTKEEASDVCRLRGKSLVETARLTFRERHLQSGSGFRAASAKSVVDLGIATFFQSCAGLKDTAIGEQK